MFRSCDDGGQTTQRVSRGRVRVSSDAKWAVGGSRGHESVDGSSPVGFLPARGDIGIRKIRRLMNPSFLNNNLIWPRKQEIDVIVPSCSLQGLVFAISFAFPARRRICFSCM